MENKFIIKKDFKNSCYKVDSFAKVNMFLHILGKDKNNYHNIQTLFEFINLKDEIFFTKRKDNLYKIKSNLEICNIEDNLVYKSCKTLESYANKNKLCGFDIYINKKIPMGAGLGGGSSNAGFTLKFLNEFWDCNLSLEKLMILGNNLGCDVPIFIYGKNSFAKGTGNIFTQSNFKKFNLILFLPHIYNSTKSFFQNPKLKKDYKEIDINNYDFYKTENAFQNIFLEKNPQINNIFSIVSNFYEVRLTGTGSSFFAFCEKDQDFNINLNKIRKKLPNNIDIIPTFNIKLPKVNYVSFS